MVVTTPPGGRQVCFFVGRSARQLTSQARYCLAFARKSFPVSNLRHSWTDAEPGCPPHVHADESPPTCETSSPPHARGDRKRSPRALVSKPASQANCRSSRPPASQLASGERTRRLGTRGRRLPTSTAPSQSVLGPAFTGARRHRWRSTRRLGQSGRGRRPRPARA